MSRNVSVSAVFTYAYRVAQPYSPLQGGFSVNVFDSDVLVYTCYDVDKQPVQECRFQLQQGSAAYCVNYIEGARWWLKNLPARLKSGEGGDTVLVGFSGAPMCCLDGFDSLALCPFGSARGHYTRAVYNLMEDMASVLAPQGLMMQPGGFRWDEQRIRPVSDQRYPSRYDSQQQAGAV